MSPSDRHDTWAAGDLYEAYVGRWSRPVAAAFVDWLAVPAHADWVDVGCGTGALTETILQRADPHTVKGVDASAGFVAHAKARIADPRASFETADAQAPPLDGASADAVVAGLLLNFVPMPLRALGEMVRVVRPGGTVAAYVWDYAHRMELMRFFWDAAVALDPEAAELDEARRFPLCQPQPLAQLFAEAGMTDVLVRPIDIPTRFEHFDAYWSPFLGGQGPAPGYAMSLDETRRGALKTRLQATLPIAPDGTIDLVARAWAVRGRR